MFIVSDFYTIQNPKYPQIIFVLIICIYICICNRYTHSEFTGESHESLRGDIIEIFYKL